VTCSIGRTSHQSLILYTVARLDTRWRDIEDGNGLPVTMWARGRMWCLQPHADHTLEPQFHPLTHACHASFSRHPLLLILSHVSPFRCPLFPCQLFCEPAKSTWSLNHQYLFKTPCTVHQLF